MVFASKRKIAPVIMAERVTSKAQLYKPNVILVRARAPSGSAQTELAQVILLHLLLIIFIIFFMFCFSTFGCKCIIYLLE